MEMYLCAHARLMPAPESMLLFLLLFSSNGEWYTYAVCYIKGIDALYLKLSTLLGDFGEV